MRSTLPPWTTSDSAPSGWIAALACGNRGSPMLEFLTRHRTPAVIALLAVAATGGALAIAGHYLIGALVGLLGAVAALVVSVIAESAASDGNSGSEQARAPVWEQALIIAALAICTVL